ncbi:probable LRR receptor-like serine/threonine-protein kinase At3g47570 [Quercus lobata]|uniref:probable LRR receptor-like serine/threonine-protein kinase At3g47570 n=1 Tax=Quercus lobata TaxID=97700 RepID=UPI001248F2EB|nr:probable LRR receptor-like serine/threonine-protein kinase At3g47570 [Quercus lobata]
MNHFRISNNNLGNGGENDLGFLCSLTNDTYLTSLHVNGNNFGGELPKCIGNLSTTLILLFLDDNVLSGKIPIEMGNLINLEELHMWQNNLSGNIPSEIGMLQKLQFLALNNNNFYGKIPSKIGKLQKLQLLAFNTNNFYGNIPSSVGNLTFLTYSLGSCVKLEYLYMESNLFQGTIPPSFESLRGLQLLDLSNNNLIGQIPKFLEVFDYLEYLNLSYNNFEGEVPTDGVFKNTSATFLEENSQLCGGILEKKRKDNTLSDSGNLHLNLSYQSLLNATNGFSSTNLIGVGSFGSVYKGILDQGRQTDIVAIKVLTSCSGIDYQGHNFKALVYKFMENVNLDEWLHPTSGMDEAVEEPKNLSLL